LARKKKKRKVQLGVRSFIYYAGWGGGGGGGGIRSREILMGEFRETKSV